MSSLLLEGGIYTVSKDVGAGDTSVCLEGCTSWFLASYFELVDNCHRGKDNSTSKWCFEIHNSFEVSSRKIKDELSAEKPLAIVEIDDGTYAAIYSEEIIRKAQQLQIGSPPLVTEISQFSEAIEWAKKVKHAPWNTKKRKVTVTIPTI